MSGPQKYFKSDPNKMGRGSGYYYKRGKLKILPDGRLNKNRIVYWSKVDWGLDSKRKSSGYRRLKKKDMYVGTRIGGTKKSPKFGSYSQETDQPSQKDKPTSGIMYQRKHRR